MQEKNMQQSMETARLAGEPKTSSVSPLAEQMPDGTQLVAPNMQPSENFRPLHSYTQSTLAPTSEFTRYILLALPSRYLFRSFFESAFLNEHAYDWLQQPINRWIDKRQVAPLAEKLEGILKEYNVVNHPKVQDALKKPHTQEIVEGIQEFFQNEGKEVHQKIRKTFDKSGALGKLANEAQVIPHAVNKAKANDGVAKLTTTGRNKLRGAIRHNYGHIGYGLALGTGSLWLGLSYSWNVYKDMQHLFTETVAYELDKDPASVTTKDILTSENTIVNRTAKNFWAKLAERAGLAAPFFFVAKALPVGLADFTVGLTSARLLQETWNRKPTMFEDLVGFVNHKINPQNGLGQPITIDEIFDLYQHYSYYNQPDKAFNNVTNRNNEEARRWSESQIMFQRIVQLLNHSYAYKHTTQYDEQGNVLKIADFTLPKFIYLLGHNLIDAHEPAKSLAYVEIANAHGIQAVKKAQNLFEKGADLQQVRDEFSLGVSDIRKLRDQIENATGTRPGGGQKPNTKASKAENHIDASPSPSAKDSSKGEEMIPDTLAPTPKPVAKPEKAVLATQIAHEGAVQRPHSKQV